MTVTKSSSLLDQGFTRQSLTVFRNFHGSNCCKTDATYDLVRVANMELMYVLLPSCYLGYPRPRAGDLEVCDS